MSGEWVECLRRGVVIPAHPLALTAKRKLDERRQRALTRYYLAAGAGGVAVGVHTTQFGIRKQGMLRPVLELAREASRESPGHGPGVNPPVLVAGICGPTRQAVREAELAAELGYHAGLVSLAGHGRATTPRLISHLRSVARVIPVFGFYLQPAVGGRVLDYGFWRRFLGIENVVAIKIAPFDRYRTLDVVRAVADSGRAGEIALYTGNDDHIILDLLASCDFGIGTAPGAGSGGRRGDAEPRPASEATAPRSLRIVGGLLGHWALWTRRAVEYFERCRQVMDQGLAAPPQLLTLAAQVTDANGAIFDATHGFAGCIPGIHEVLRRPGLLAGRWCLNPREQLSAGQMEEIDRVWSAYPHLRDDEFVQEHLDDWLR